MGFLVGVIGAAPGAKAPPAQSQSPQSQSPQSAPAQDEFSQIAAPVQELLAPDLAPLPGGQAAAPTSSREQSLSGLALSGLGVLLRQLQENDLVKSSIPDRSRAKQPDLRPSCASRLSKIPQRSAAANGCATE